MAAAPDLLAPDELADMMESPDFAALPAFERAQMFDAGLEESRTWLKTNAGDDETMSKAFDETAHAMARRYRPAESDIELSRQSPVATAGTAAFRALGEVATGTVGGIAKAGAQYEKLRENLTGIPSSGVYEKVAGFTDAVADMGRDYSYPTNPNNPTANTIGSGAGQAVGMLGTAAASLPALGARALVAVPVGIGAAMGTGQGIDTAEQMGFESPAAKLAMGATFGGIEAGTEAIGGIGGKLLPMKGLLKRVTAPLVESGEEVLAGRLQDVTQRVAGPAVADPARPGYTESGYKLPSLNPLNPETLARMKQEAIGGAAGGTVFALLPGGGAEAGQPAPVMPASGQAVSPLGDIAAGTFVPDAVPVERAPILGNVPDGGRRMRTFQDDPLTAPAPAGGGNVLRDFGIAKSPNAQAVADEAELARQQQAAKLRGIEARAGSRMPVIPDSPLGGRDILDFVNDNPLHIPRKGSAAAGQAENNWSETYNVPLYYRKFLGSSERGHNATDLAQMAYDDNYIQEPTADALMAKIDETIRARTTYKVEFRKREQALDAEGKAVLNFEKDQAKGASQDKTLLALEDVNPGDEMTINGEQAKVRKIEYDDDGYLTNVVIEDGKRYGVLSLDPQTRAGVFVDEWTPKAREAVEPDPFSPEVVAAEKVKAQERAAVAAEGLTTLSSKPVVTSATLKGDTIYLEFDALEAKPTLPELRESFPGAMIEEMRPDIISGTQGNVKYRIIGLNENGSMSSKAAKDIYVKAFGSEQSIRGETRFQRMGSLSDRFQIGQKIAGIDDKLASLGARGKSEQGFKNLTIEQDLQAGFMSTAGVDALFDLANAAITAGKTFVQWSAEMVKKFGEQIRDYLAHVWAVAKDSLPTTAAQNVRLGTPAKPSPVKLSDVGAVINLLPSLKGGTKVFHAKGEPFRVNYLGARQLLTGSPLPAELVPVLTRTQQEKKALEQRAAQLGRDLQTAIDKEVDRSGRTPEQVNKQVAKMMGGDVQAAALLSIAAPVLHERTRTVRVLLDNLSTAVGQTLAAGPLKQTIMGNLGAWLRRSYAAFDPASGWNYDALLRHAAAGTQIAGKDAAKILNEARAHLRSQNQQATTQQIEADLRDLMDRDVWERELTGSGAKKSTSSLMRRKDIAPEIRAVMGEEQNPVKLLTSSAGFQAQFIARHHGQVAMRNAGLATGLFSNQRGGVYTEQIPVNDRAWSGFAGVWTTPQMLQALDNASGVIKEGSDLGGIIVSTLKALGNKAKLNRVALNPDSWMVNMLGNVTSLIQNGDVFAWSIIRRVAEAREITGAGDAKSGKVVNAAAEALQDAARDMQARLTESGVLGSSLTLADIEASLPRHLLQWLATDQKYDRAAGALEGAIIGQGMGRGLGLPGRAVGGAVGAVAGALAGGVKIQGWQQLAADFLMTKPDALARTTGWLTNYETGLASGMAPDAAATWATKRTLNTFPNYAALPGLMREASKLGIMGSFIAFQHEVYRNFGWNVRYAAEELNSGNPALIQRGLQRLVGIGAIAGLAGGGLAAILAATGVAGGDDERNKLFRKWFGAPWEKDAVLAFREFDAEKVSYFNTSYILPQTTIAELLQAMREGENPADAAGRVVDRLYEQFIGSSVHLGPILDALANKKRTGVPLTYKTGVAGAAERADHPLKTILEPGFAEKIERLTYAMREAERNGTKYSIEQEFRRVIGLREQTKTWPKMVEGVYRDLAKENSDIRAQANREISLNRPGASKRAVDAANAQIDALRQKLGDFERDALKLGVPESVIVRAKREASIGKLPNVGLQVDGKRVISLGK